MPDHASPETHAARRRFLCVAILLLASGRVGAEEAYRQPADDIVRILEAPRLPAVSIDPTSRFMLLVERQGMPTIADLARPMMRLAGTRLDPATNGPHGSTGLIGLTVLSMDDRKTTPVPLPDDVRIGMPRWSPDGSRFAFEVVREDGIELWVGSTKTGAARRLAEAGLNAIGGGFRWMPDGRHLLVHFVPTDRPPAPVRSVVPKGPVVQESDGRASPVRTYQDLLADAHDEALFDHYFTSQLAVVEVESGDRTDIGEPAIYATASPSATGSYLLTSRIVRPYSYQVPHYRFPTIVEVRELASGRVTEVTRRPLAEDVPIQGVVTGPRSLEWWPHPDADRLFWFEALDGGDPKQEVDHRDRLIRLDAPFDGERVEVRRIEHRASGITWIEDADRALISEYDRDRRWSRTWWFAPLEPSAEAELVWDRSVQDRYGDPGRPVMGRNAAGRSVARCRDGRIFLSGRGASPAGDLPFLDVMALETLETERLFHCEEGTYETVVDVLDPDHGIVLTRFETPTTPPNYYVRDLTQSLRERITEFRDPAPQLRDVRKELVTYEREDGVRLSATLYLPPGYEEGQRLPLLVWAYPLEYNDPATASQVRGSPHRFTSITGSSHRFLLLKGYAIMDGATMPVVGEDPETVNDSFIEQIVASAQAAIDKAVDLGVADPERVGVGGHSYGAFMTANLLAHSDLFRAGIARSGAYNRTLTPFGFQSERRTFWEAPDTYFRLSPFMHAHQIDEPLLLIHGARDNNSGTFPMQSERLFHAVKGHGGTARLVMLPYESHGYRAKESVLHVLAEMIDWFDHHVKGATAEASGGG
ncbi:MAG: S9 family peptidase [Planctomycetota bacterium]|jgi:dipeptidyl aminopeptidase/acylaminoacyl peptidase